MQTLAHLNDLPLNQTQKAKIASHYKDVRTLYKMCRAMPEAVKERLELKSLDALIKALEGKLSPAERQAVQTELDAMGS